MDAAFDLVPAGPAAAPGVFTGGNLAGAGGAADRGIACVHQRVARQIVHDEPGFDLACVPVDKRVDLEAALGIRGVQLEAREVGAGARLERLASREAGVETAERLSQRADLADFAAAVGIEGPAQPGLVACGQIGRIRREDAQVGEAQPLYQCVTISQRLGEMLARVEEQHRHGGVDGREQVQQHCAFRAEAADSGDLAGQPVFEHAFEHRKRIAATEQIVEPHGIVCGEARTSVEPVNGADDAAWRIHADAPCRSAQIGTRASAAG